MDYIDMKAIDNNGRTPLIWKQYIIMEGLHWYESNRWLCKDFIDMKTTDVVDGWIYKSIAKIRLFAETFKHCVKSKSRKSIKLEKEG